MNTYIPNVTMHLSSIANAVNIINTLDGKSYPVPASLDHRTIGNLFKQINADYSTVPGNVRAYANDINAAFLVLDTLYIASPPTASAPVFAGPVPDQTGTIGAAIAFDIGAYFTGADIVYTSTGVALPTDLVLSASTGIISSVAGLVAATIDHKITATNNSGVAVSDLFNITIS